MDSQTRLDQSLLTLATLQMDTKRKIWIVGQDQIWVFVNLSHTPNGYPKNHR